MSGVFGGGSIIINLHVKPICRDHHRPVWCMYTLYIHRSIVGISHDYATLYHDYTVITAHIRHVYTTINHVCTTINHGYTIINHGYTTIVSGSPLRVTLLKYSPVANAIF
jgi:hypothetical protein